MLGFKAIRCVSLLIGGIEFVGMKATGQLLPSA